MGAGEAEEMDDMISGSFISRTPARPASGLGAHKLHLLQLYCII